MNSLWIISSKKDFYLTPSYLNLITAVGELIPEADEYKVAIGGNDLSCEEAVSFYVQKKVSLLILVPEDQLFNQTHLMAIPKYLPILMLYTQKSTMAVCQQLNYMDKNGCLFGEITGIEFARTVDNIAMKKNAMELAKDDVKKYSNLAFTAMTSASEMGVVVQFSERAQSIMDMPQLARALMSCFKDLNVDGVVQFSFNDQVLLFPEKVSLAHQQLLSGGEKVKERIISVGPYVVFHFNRVQVLIINAPASDTEHHGRLCDIIAQITAVAESRLKTLIFNSLLKTQQDNSNKVMRLLEMASKDNREAVKTIMTGLSAALQDMASGLYLTLEQEKELLKLSDDALEGLQNLQQANISVEQHFQSLLLEFGEIIAQLDNASTLLSRDTSTDDIVGNKMNYFE